MLLYMHALEIETQEIKGRDEKMTRDEKKQAINEAAKIFMGINNIEGKSMVIMVMSAYAEGKAAGKEEERKRWEEKEAAEVTA